MIRGNKPLAAKGSKPLAAKGNRPLAAQSAKAQPSRARRVLEEKYQAAARARSRASLLTRLALTLAAVYLALGVVAGASRISGASMEPKIESGDLVLFRRTKKVEPGDIVILHTDEDTHMVKRVVAAGGDTVDIDDATGALQMNGVRASEDYIYTRTYTRENGISFPVTVPEGEVFVLGDNRTVSKDSREFGAVPTDRIDGKVFCSFRLLKQSEEDQIKSETIREDQKIGRSEDKSRAMNRKEDQ